MNPGPPSEEVPPLEHDHEGRVAHQTEEPVAEHTEELVVHHKEVNERLSEKTASRGQSPEPKNWELKKMMRLYEYQARQTRPERSGLRVGFGPVLYGSGSFGS